MHHPFQVSHCERLRYIQVVYLVLKLKSATTAPTILTAAAARVSVDV